MPEPEIIPREISLLSQIQEILRNKYWYSAKSDGSFDWHASTEELAKGLQEVLGWGDRDKIGEAIESSFTPQSLTQIKSDPSKSFISALKETGTEIFIWTVGDCDWQGTKFEKCGLEEFVDENHYDCVVRNKQQSLLRILRQIKETEENEKPTHVYVVDNKPENLAEAMKLEKKAINLGINLHNYHLKLKDTSADPTTCYRYLEQRIQEHGQQGRVIIILDLDGVVIDTDRTILEVASHRILQKLERITFANIMPII